MNDPTTGAGQQGIGDAYMAASGKARSGLDQAASATASVKDAGSDVAGQAKDQVSSLVEQAKDKAFATANEQKAGLADRIDEIAAAVHKSGEQFAGQQDWIAGAIEHGAVELASLASALRDNDLPGLVDQVRSVARRQPALFIGAALVAGFAVARLGKLVAADVSSDDLPTMPEVGHGGH